MLRISPFTNIMTKSAVFIVMAVLAGMALPSLTTAQSQNSEETYRQLSLFGDVFQRVRSSYVCLLYTSPSPRDYAASRMPSSA